MAQATATARAHLVIIDTQAGPQPQIWYDDGGRFVGCGHLKPVERYPLPDCIVSRVRSWTIDDALTFIAQEQRNAA